MTERLLTPTKITAWLDCAHFLTLKNQVEDLVRPTPPDRFGSFAQLLQQKGLDHEHECLADYERQGKTILTIPDRPPDEAFGAWVQRVGNPFDLGYDVIYQMPFVHDGVRGIADFLIRVEDPDTGVVGYEPVDAKLARVEAKPGHVLQLCFYADAIEAATGVRPRRMHIWLGSGHQEHLVVDEFRAYWHRIQAQLATVLDAPSDRGPTTPEPCRHCDFCEFFEVCEAQWRAEDSLIYVAGIRPPERLVLAGAGVATLDALTRQYEAVDGVRPERLHRLANQAALQAAARLLAEDEHPPYDLIEPGDDDVWGRGLELLPAADDGDVFLDFEGHPFWRADAGLFFLFGLIEREPSDQWRYRTWWAHDLAEEAIAAESLIQYLADRRAAHPKMHVYHYNHTERSSLERLAADHGVGEITLTGLVETGCFVDLLVVARNAMQVGTEGYGLKHLERLTDFERGHEIDAGAGAVLEYEQYMRSRGQAALDRIASYNEDDVRATRALRDWLVDHRPPDTPWRAAVLVPEDTTPQLSEQTAALHAFGPGTPEHLLGDVLGYWKREWLAYLAPRRTKLEADPSTLLDDPEVLACLTPVGKVDRLGAKDKVLDGPGMRFTLPDQDTGGFRPSGNGVIYTAPDGRLGFASIHRFDPEAGEVDLTWSDKADELGVTPSALALNDYVHPDPKPVALSQLATRVLGPAGPKPNRASLALLRRDRPTFVPSGGPPGATFTDDLGQMNHWAGQLDHSYVAIQGPPGTGKTFRAAHLVRTLILAGRRVGITAFSHQAIANLVDEILLVLDQEGDRDQLRAVRKVSKTPEPGGPIEVRCTTSNATCAKGGFNLVAGTTWLFANDLMLASPVDVLLVDEAGQLALADVLAASRAAQNLVLLGDPSQLAQVSQASHPGGGGLSVLGHVLGDHVTLPDDRGVFLTVTRRMHPDVCSFISEEIYEGKLTSHSSCAGQTTAFGTGLRWLPAHHVGRSTESAEEAELVSAEIRRLMGTEWTDQQGRRAPLGVDDFMVVAPFNDQVAMMRARLDADPRTRGVRVGTVDKFQGGQAAVVFFTMTTSTAADMTRGVEFLFSRNRLNVAISRARCLAYLVCTEELLNSRAHDVDQMRLISTLCAFVERVDQTSRASG